MKTIAIANQKGGVGKTNVAFNTAGVFSELDYRVLIVDMDAQATITEVFLENAQTTKPSVFHLLDEDPLVEIKDVIRKTHLKNIDLLPANQSLKRLDANLSGVNEADFFLREALQELADSYDVVLIDCPPNLSRATRMALVAADGVIAPLECAEESVQGSSVLVAEIESVKKNLNPNLEFLGFVVNLYIPRRSMQQQYYEIIKEQLGDNLFKTMFRNHTEYSETIPQRLPITFYKPKSEQAELYRQFIKELF